MADNRDKVRNGSALGKYGAMNLDTLTDALVDGDTGNEAHAAEVQRLRDEIERLQGELSNQSNAIIPEGAIVPQEDGTWLIGNVQMKSTGLAVHGEVGTEQWLQLGVFLRKMTTSFQWLIGDWVVGCQNVWADTYQEVVKETGFKYSTVSNLAYVARNVPLSVRTDSLKFAHYKLLAKFPPDEQLRWVEEAVAKNWGVADLRLALNPPALSDGVLGDKKNRKRFNKLWRNINNIDAISLDDIDAMKKWLETLERMKRG